MPCLLGLIVILQSSAKWQMFLRLKDKNSTIKKCPTEMGLLQEYWISAIYAEIGMAFADLPPLEKLSQFPKTTNDFTFFEALVEQTKLAGIKSQKLLFCIQNLKKEKLLKKIESLRANYDANYLDILHAERELGKIHDTELRDKLQDLKIFEIFLT